MSNMLFHKKHNYAICVDGDSNKVERFEITGRDVYGRRFRRVLSDGTWQSLNLALCLNLYSGTRWAVIRGKRRNLEKTPLYKKIIPHYLVHGEIFPDLAGALAFGYEIQRTPKYFGYGEPFAVKNHLGETVTYIKGGK